jgi:metal-sulfur cluster biosynthetic enzyme
LFSQIEVEVKNKLQSLGVDGGDVDIELTFDPPWTMEKMTEKAKAMLGI